MKKSLIIVLSIVCLGDGVVYGALLAIMVAPVQGEAAVVRAVRYPLSPTATAIWRNYQRVIWDGSERTECASLRSPNFTARDNVIYQRANQRSVELDRLEKAYEKSSRVGTDRTCNLDYMPENERDCSLGKISQSVLQTRRKHHPRQCDAMVQQVEKERYNIRKELIASSKECIESAYRLDLERRRYQELERSNQRAIAQVSELAVKLRQQELEVKEDQEALALNNSLRRRVNDLRGQVDSLSSQLAHKTSLTAIQVDRHARELKESAALAQSRYTPGQTYALVAGGCLVTAGVVAAVCNPQKVKSMWQRCVTYVGRNYNQLKQLFN